MSQETLGEHAGVKYQTIGQYENEEAWPGWAKWMKMAEALDVTVGWLIAGEFPMERQRSHGPPTKQKPGKPIKRPPPRQDPEEGNDEPRQRRA